MGALTQEKQAAIATLVCAAPDPVLTALERAFANAPIESRAGFVRERVAGERRDRLCLAAVMGPVLPVFRSRPDGVPAPAYPASTPRLLWQEIKSRRADGVASLEARLLALEYDETVPEQILNGFCAEAAAILREERPDRWGLSDEVEAEAVARLLDLAPLVRRALPNLDNWLGRVTEERAAALRLVFRDATAVADDATPRLMEIFLSHLPQAHLILRLIPIIAHGAGEGLVAGSELAPLGERLLGDAEARLERANSFGPRSDAAAAGETVRELGLVGATLTELDACLELSRDGVWGRRVAAGRERANAILEKSLRQAEKAVDRALPTLSVRLAGRLTRPAPDLDAEPVGPAIDQARALLTLLSESRQLAATLGSTAVRSRVCEDIGERLDAYVEALLQSLHAGELEKHEAVRAKALIEVAASFVGLVRDEAAGRLVRRRLAVALADAAANSPSQRVA